MNLKLGSMKILFKTKHIKDLRQIMPVIIAFVVLFVIVVYPLATILLQSLFPNIFDVTPSLKPSFGVIQNVFTKKYTYEAIMNSLLIGFFSTVIATFIGTGLAIINKRCDIKFLKVVDLFAWLVFITPSYLIAQGWILLLQRNGILSQVIPASNSISNWFFTPVTLVVIMGLKHFPLVYIAVSNALLGLGSEYENASRLSGASQLTSWFRINIPLLVPAMLAGAAIVFAEGIGDFGLTASIVRSTHLPVITYAIFAALNQSPVNYPLAGALSFILIIIISITLILQLWFLKRGSYSIIKNQISASNKIKTGLNKIWLYPLVGFILIISYVVPIVTTLIASLMKTISHGLEAGNFTFDHYMNAFNIGGDSWNAISLSMELALGAAVVAVILGLALAYIIQYTEVPGRKVLYFLTMSTIAIPGIVLAAGFVFAFNAIWLVPLHLAIYGTIACLYLAYIAEVLPYSVRLHVSALTQISPALITAGRIHGSSSLSLFRRIIIPLVASTSISTFFLAFVHTLFELPASQLLYPPGSPPFSTVLDTLYQNNQWENGAALTIIAVITTIALYSIGQAASKKFFSVSYSSHSNNSRKSIEKSERNNIQESLQPVNYVNKTKSEMIN